MAHIDRIQTEARDPLAVAAACRRLRLPEPAHGTATLFEGPATGLLVKLPDWLYPIVIAVAAGGVRYDNYVGQGGRPEELARFLQAYAVEQARIEALKRAARPSPTSEAWTPSRRSARGPCAPAGPPAPAPGASSCWGRPAPARAPCARPWATRRAAPR